MFTITVEQEIGKKIYFRYKAHPGDLLRNTDIVELPDPEDNDEEFLVWFLDHYQSDNRIAYLDDLHKLLHNDFASETDRFEFLEEIGNKTEIEVKHEIESITGNLKNDAFRNFYNLVLTNKIELISG